MLIAGGSRTAANTVYLGLIVAWRVGILAFWAALHGLGLSAPTHLLCRFRFRFRFNTAVKFWLRGFVLQNSPIAGVCQAVRTYRHTLFSLVLDYGVRGGETGNLV
jgi:hypothetical protein